MHEFPSPGPSSATVRFDAVLTPLIVILALTPAAPAQTQLFAVDATPNLLRFDSAVPATILTTSPITGLQTSETIVGIDFRPLDGQLFGVGDTSRLYRINPVNGAATQVGTGVFAGVLNGVYFGVNFNPVADRLRVVSNAGVSIRLKPDDASEVLDTPLTYAAGDPHAGAMPAISAVGYDRNATGATATTLFGIDAAQGTLVHIGGVDGTPSPNSGVCSTIGPMGISNNSRCNLDIGPNDLALAAIETPGVFITHLYNINLSSGAASDLGLIGDGHALTGLAIAPVGRVEFNASSFVVNEGDGTATVAVIRKGGDYGEVTVQYSTSNGTAGASDYTTTSGTLSFDSGETTKSFTIPINNDSQHESDETVNITLSSPGGGATLGSTTTAVLTIVDNDTASLIPGFNCGTGMCGLGTITMLPLSIGALAAFRRGRGRTR